MPEDVRGVRFARDVASFGGPLVGCQTGLRRVGAAVAVIAAGDMPGLRPEVVSVLRRRLQESAARAAVLSDGERPRPLPLAVEVGPALLAAERLLATPERRLRALVEALDAVVLGPSDWRVADPDGTWREDIDAPRDLERGARG